MRKGFTLIELLVVSAMLMLLVGAVTSATMSAQRRAKIAKATTACREMTNAILAYENYAENYTFEADKITGDSWRAADSSFLSFILGEETAKNGTGDKIPVLYNGEVTKGRLLDPWKNPYQVRIARSSATTLQRRGKATSLRTCVMFPNFRRRLAGEQD